MCDVALERLIEGFRRFRKEHYTEEESPFTRLVREGQSPKVLLIACSDSRVDPAITLGSEAGDLFVIRNVANLVPPCEHDSAQHGASAALEYAVRNLEVEHIVVKGHAHCGGIRALIDDPEAMRPDSDSFIKRWMSLAAPAYWRARERHPDADDDLLAKECEKDSVLLSLRNLETFPWVKERMDAGKLKLHGWYFDLVEGELSTYDPETKRFQPVPATADE